MKGFIEIGFGELKEADQDWRPVFSGGSGFCIGQQVSFVAVTKDQPKPKAGSRCPVDTAGAAHLQAHFHFTAVPLAAKNRTFRKNLRRSASTLEGL